MMPKRNADTMVFAVRPLCIPLKKGSLMTSRYERPKIIISSPPTIFTAVLYSLRNAPSVPANSPSRLNTTVKPSTKLSALKNTLCFLSAPPAKYETYIGRSGSMQGEMKDINPSRNVMTNSIYYSFAVNQRRRADNRSPQLPFFHMG